MLLMRHAGSPAPQSRAGGSVPPVPSCRTLEQRRTLSPLGTGHGAQAEKHPQPKQSLVRGTENGEQTRSSSLRIPWLQHPRTGSAFCDEKRPGGHLQRAGPASGACFSSCPALWRHFGVGDLRWDERGQKEPLCFVPHLATVPALPCLSGSQVLRRQLQPFCPRCFITSDNNYRNEEL